MHEQLFMPVQRACASATQLDASHARFTANSEPWFRGRNAFLPNSSASSLKSTFIVSRVIPRKLFLPNLETPAVNTMQSSSNELLRYDRDTLSALIVTHAASANATKYMMRTPMEEAKCIVARTGILKQSSKLLLTIECCFNRLLHCVLQAVSLWGGYML